MSTVYWIGKSTAVAQVTTVTVGGTLSGETFTISVGGVAIATHTDSDTLIASAKAALIAAWNASTHPYATGVTASAGGTGEVVLTADVAGVPFVVTLNTPGGSATLGQTATTASAGPNHWDTAANWSGGAVPVAADDVIIRQTEVPILFGLDRSSVNALASLTVERSAESGFVIGLPIDQFYVSEAGGFDDDVPEYRGTYLEHKATVVRIGEHYGPGSPSGSGRIKINTLDAASAITVFGAASPTETTLPAVRLLATHASSTLRVLDGSVGVACDAPGETSTLVSVTMNGETSASLVIGAGTTLTTYRQTAGSGVVRNAPTNLYVDGGTIEDTGSGTITMTEIGAGVLWDFSGSTKTYTDAYAQRGARCVGDVLKITLTNGLRLRSCQPSDVSLTVGSNVKLTFAAA
jgi:hypothetical protein